MAEKSKDTDKRGKWSDPSVLASLIPSIFAFGLSLVAIFYSMKGYVLTVKDFHGARAAVWQATPKADGFYYVSSISDNIKMQRGEILFPAGIDSKRELVPPDFNFPTAQLKDNLQKYIKKKNFPVKESKETFSDNLRIPILIDSAYISRGELLEDISLYDLIYSFTMSKADCNEPHIQFKGIIIKNRFRSRQDGLRSLEDAWKQICSRATLVHE